MGGCGRRGLRLESRDRGSRDAGDMTDLQQYRLRLALSVPPSFAFALTGMSIPDLFYKDQTVNGLWALFAITFGISTVFALLLYFLLKESLSGTDIFQPASEPERKKNLRNGSLMLLVPILAVLWLSSDAKSSMEFVVTAGCGMASMLVMATTIWLFWGKWFMQEVQKRRELELQEEPTSTNSELLSS